MKHVKSVSKKATPSKAFVWEWFVDTKPFPGVGIIQGAGKPACVDALWTSPDSIDPNDPADIP